MIRDEREAPKLANWLREHGWFRSEDGWRHPLLETTWPFWHAVRLQHETNQGRTEPVHRTLREEAW